MEVVIALAIVGFALPLIMAATSSTGNTLRNAEADTRSAWIARHVQRQIIAKWAEPPIESEITSAFDFPVTGTEESTAVLIFDREGTFLSEGSSDDLTASSQVPDAVFAANITAKLHENSLALVSITINHPAKAPAAKRSSYRYKFLTTRQGNQ